MQLAHFGAERLEVRAILAHQSADFVEPHHHVGDRLHAQADILHDPFRLVELGLLLEVTDSDVGPRPRLAGEFLVAARHDLHQRRLAGAVGADDTDLGIGVELQADVAQHRLGGTGKGLAETLHDE